MNCTNDIRHFRKIWQLITRDRRGPVHLRLLALRVRDDGPHGWQASAPTAPAAALAPPDTAPFIISGVVHRSYPAHAEDRHGNTSYEILGDAHEPQEVSR